MTRRKAERKEFGHEAVRKREIAAAAAIARRAVSPTATVLGAVSPIATRLRSAQLRLDLVGLQAKRFCHSASAAERQVL